MITTEQKIKNLFESYYLFPQDIDFDKGTISFINVSRNNFLNSAFHDHRFIKTSCETFELKIDTLLSYHNALESTQKATHYIFHTAFCGSTLLARYLDRPNYSFVYREPSILTKLAYEYQANKIAEARIEKVLLLLNALLSRTERGEETPIVKLSDSCNPLTNCLFDINPNSYGLMLYSDLEDFLICILKHSDRRKFLRSRLSTCDIDHINFLQHVDKTILTDAEAATCLWISQIYTCQKAMQQHPSKLASLNCKVLYEEPATVVKAVANHFSISLPDNEIKQSLELYRSVHSKTGKKFNRSDYEKQIKFLTKLYSSEINNALEFRDTLLPDKTLIESLSTLSGASVI